MKKEIYLDYASTTPTDPAVLNLMHQEGQALYGNASSIYQAGRLAKRKIEEARATVTGILGTKKNEIIFTGSGTEADNLAILGAARANKEKSKHIIVSAIEHKAILEPAKLLKKEGFEISYAPVDKKGILDLVAFEKLLSEDTILVSVMYANNEIGTIQPIKKISEIIKKHKSQNGFPLFHTDACQAAGVLDLNAAKLGVDMMTINGSKIYGPKGIGCLYVKEGVKIEPQIVGGGQERGMRAGTENPSLILGLARALEISEKKKLKENRRLSEMRDYLIKKIKKEIKGAYLNGHPTKRLPNNINFSFAGLEGEALVLLLDDAKIYCSTGSACSSSDLNPSHVLLAIGLSPELAHGSLRLTLGRGTNKKDLDKTINELKKAVASLRKISSVK